MVVAFLLVSLEVERLVSFKLSGSRDVPHLLR